MKDANVPDDLAESILLGLAQGDYKRVARQFIDGFGLSRSLRRNFCDSRHFQERAEQALQEFQRRSL